MLHQQKLRFSTKGRGTYNVTKQITEAIEKELQVKDGCTTADDKYTLESVACLGCCSLAPVMMIEDDTAGRLTPASARQALDTVAVAVAVAKGS